MPRTKYRREALYPCCASFVIPGRLDGLNDHISACNSQYRIGNSLKQGNGSIVTQAIIAAKLPHISRPIHLAFDWYEANKRRDPDNIAFAHKYILDALVSQGVIDGDGWKELWMPEPFRDRFFVDKDNPHIKVTIVTSDDSADIAMERGTDGVKVNTQQENA